MFTNTINSEPQHKSEMSVLSVIIFHSIEKQRQQKDTVTELTKVLTNNMNNLYLTQIIRDNLTKAHSSVESMDCFKKRSSTRAGYTNENYF